MSKTTTVPALHDAEVLAGQLVWTLDQILDHSNFVSTDPTLWTLESAHRLAVECGRLVREAKDL